MGIPLDLTGMQFGNLTVIEKVESNKKATLWRCRCSCGKETVVQLGNLRSGHTKSCGKCNTVIVHGGFMECVVKNGRTFLFDEEDLPLVKACTWTVDKDGYVRGQKGDKSIRFHRIIMGAEDDEIVDHINGNPSDCRKENLRIVNQHQNTMNHSLNKNSTTGYKGVCLDKKYDKYMAHIHPDGKMIFLGYYNNPVEAALAYDKAASFYFGEYAKLNFEEVANI